MFTRKTRPGWMAVDLRAGGVRVAHVARERPGRARVALLRSFDRAGSEADDLIRLRKSIGLGAYRCTTSVDASSYQIVQLAAPAVPAGEVNAALLWSVKDSIDFPIDDAVIGSLHVPADGAAAGRAPQVLAVAARRSRVSARVQAFQRAGIALEVIDVAETAQRNLAGLFEQPDRGLAFLAFDASGGLLTFSRNGQLYALRRIAVSTASLADGAPETERQALYERIGLELQRSLDNFDRLFSQIALQRILVAPHDGRDALVAYLRKNLALPVDAAELESVLESVAGAAFGGPAEQAEWLHPIGLALRQEAA